MPQSGALRGFQAVPGRQRSRQQGARAAGYHCALHYDLQLKSTDRTLYYWHMKIEKNIQLCPHEDKTPLRTAFIQR